MKVVGEWQLPCNHKTPDPAEMPGFHEEVLLIDIRYHVRIPVHKWSQCSINRWERSPASAEHVNSRLRLLGPVHIGFPQLIVEAFQSLHTSLRFSSAPIYAIYRFFNNPLVILQGSGFVNFTCRNRGLGFHLQDSNESLAQVLLSMK